MSDILARIAAHSGSAPIPYHVKEWELDCYIRPLSVAVMYGKIDKQPMPERMYETIMYGLVDQSGKPILPNDAESFAALAKVPWKVIDRIAADILGAKFDRTDAKNS